MKRRSVWIVLVASLLLLTTTQTDLAFASLKASTNNSASLNISTISWGAFAGVNANAALTGNAYGPITPVSAAVSYCPGVPLYYITTDGGGWDGLGQKVKFQSSNWSNSIAVAMTITLNSGLNPLVSTITAVNYSTREITFSTTGNNPLIGSTADNYLTYVVGDASVSCCVTTDYYLTTDGNGWSNSSRRVGLQTATTALAVGMTVTGTGIVSSGTNTISAIDNGNQQVTLTLGPNTSANYTTLKFSTPCPGGGVTSSSLDAYFTIQNSGNTPIQTLSITQTVTVTASNSIKLQTCNVAGTGTTSAAWNENTGTCAGTINTIMTTTNTNSPQTVSAYSIPISVGGDVRIRAVSTQAGKTTRISVSASTTDVRASRNSIS